MSVQKLWTLKISPKQHQSNLVRCLNSASTSGRKASTPIQDRTAPSVSPDISHVFPVGSNTSGIGEFDL